jgi:voltage-gated potassium channel Kch
LADATKATKNSGVGKFFNACFNQGYVTLFADASRNSILERAGINNGAKAVLCTTNNDITNVYITLTSRYLNPDITIISRANHEENAKKMLQAGASYGIFTNDANEASFILIKVCLFYR